MYLTLPNAFYETYVVTVVSFLVVLLLSAGFKKHVQATADRFEEAVLAKPSLEGSVASIFSGSSVLETM